MEDGQQVLGGPLYQAHFFFLSVNWNFSIIKTTKNRKKERGEKEKRGLRWKGKRVKGRGESEQGNRKRMLKGKREGEIWTPGDATDTPAALRLHAGCAALPDKTWESSKAPQGYPGKNSDRAQFGCASHPGSLIAFLSPRRPPWGSWGSMLAFASAGDCPGGSNSGV